jgi:monoamine oxidase
VVTEGGGRFAARQVLVTVPLGVWQAGALRFVPDLPAKFEASRRMGFGGVIKLVLEFREAFWEPSGAARPGWRTFPGLGFLFSDAPVPTWWTRLPDRAPVLTGWLAGPAAASCAAVPADALLDIALNSLSALVLAPPGALRALLAAHHVANWPADPYARGAYSYTTVDGEAARATLAAPVDGTLFFAGEALYQGPAVGTVEAALATGVRVAGEMLGAEGAGPGAKGQGAG